MDEIVNTIYIISGSFAGVNLEDISAGRCFEIERKLKDFSVISEKMLIQKLSGVCGFQGQY